MIFFRCVNNYNDTFQLRELIRQRLKNIQKKFQIDRMSNCEIGDHQKVCRVTLTQCSSCLKEKLCAPRDRTQSVLNKLNFKNN